MIQKVAKQLVPNSIWSFVRERKIIRAHSRIAAVCNGLVHSYSNNAFHRIEVPALVKFPDNTRLIWQYWAQGFDNVPDIVSKCLDSVDRYCNKYTVIRLDDSNICNYLDLPNFVLEKKSLFGYAHFSDLLRVLLLDAYGGIWMDATIMLTGPLSESLFEKEFFAFQRDKNEKRKDYWRNTYAYYFSWSKGFRVNMLNSFMASKPKTALIKALGSCMLEWWKQHESMPDYFFFQILFDVLANGYFKEMNCDIQSDCTPHYLQQFMNDTDFFIKSKEEIYSITSIHKLTYK